MDSARGKPDNYGSVYVHSKQASLFIAPPATFAASETSSRTWPDVLAGADAQPCSQQLKLQCNNLLTLPCRCSPSALTHKFLQALVRPLYEGVEEAAAAEGACINYPKSKQNYN